MSYQPREDHALDQIVYRYSDRHLLGKPGMGPVASSLRRPELEYLDSTLIRRVGDANMPYPNLWYLVRGKIAMLMYRAPDQVYQVPGQHEDDPSAPRRKQAFAHVVIGWRTDLKASLAIGAWEWRWPDAIRPDSTHPLLHLKAIQLDSFTNAAKSGYQSLLRRPPALDITRRLTEAMRLHQTRDPQIQMKDKFVVFTDEKTDLAPRILAAAIERRGEGEIGDGFSTYESAYSDKIPLPRFVFTTGDPLKRGLHLSNDCTREVVDLRMSALAPSQQPITTPPPQQPIQQPITTPPQQPITTPSQQPATTPPPQQPITTPSQQPFQQPITTPPQQPITTPSQQPIAPPQQAFDLYAWVSIAIALLVLLFLSFAAGVFL